jgi:hypothetical protein
MLTEKAKKVRQMKKAKVQLDKYDAWACVIWNNKVLLKDYKPELATYFVKGFNEAIKRMKNVN